jgi:hypothetical protein
MPLSKWLTATATTVQMYCYTSVAYHAELSMMRNVTVGQTAKSLGISYERNGDFNQEWTRKNRHKTSKHQ